jgi:hypothetical protein
MENSIKALLKNQSIDIVHAFAKQLSGRLGRSEGALLEKGLGAFDFMLDEEVRLTLADGSTMALRYAFVAFDDAKQFVGVFTEHSGYFCFSTADLLIQEVKAGRVATEFRG